MSHNVLLIRPRENSCWICGSNTNLTQEHKYKASDVRRHFGRIVAHIQASGERARVAQGPNSRHYKFACAICGVCNNAVTQESDRAYDLLIAAIERRGTADEEVLKALDSVLLEGTSSYLPTFRYFAKLLGCQLGEIGAPIPRQLATFVSRKSKKNCIFLNARVDLEYRNIKATSQNWDGRYMASGGLVVITREPNLLPRRIYTTLTVGHVQFQYWYVLSTLEVLEMRLRFPAFVTWCAETARDAKKYSIPQSKLQQLGLVQS